MEDGLTKRDLSGLTLFSSFMMAQLSVAGQMDKMFFWFVRSEFDCIVYFCGCSCA